MVKNPVQKHSNRHFRNFKLEDMEQNLQNPNKKNQSLRIGNVHSNLLPTFKSLPLGSDRIRSDKRDSFLKE